MTQTNTSEEATEPITDSQSPKIAKKHLNVSASAMFGNVFVDLKELDGNEEQPAEQRVEQSIANVIDYTGYSTTQLTYVLVQLFTTYGVERKPVRDAVDVGEVTTWREIATAFCHAALVNTTTMAIDDSEQGVNVEPSEDQYREWLKSPWEIDLEVELAAKDQMHALVKDITSNAEERITLTEDEGDEVDRRIAAMTDGSEDAIGGALMYHADRFSDNNPVHQASLLTLAKNEYGVDGSDSLNHDHLKEYLAQGWRSVLTTPLVWDALAGCVRVHCSRHPEEYPTLSDALSDERGS